MPTRPLAALLLLFSTCVAQAADTVMSAHQWLDRLGTKSRETLEAPKPGRTPESVELEVVQHITTLRGTPTGPASLSAPDELGRTPLMRAAGGGHLRVVKALLAEPSVRATINQADAQGETAWMVAEFALPLTLVACQPGMLTLDRYPLLRPYLRRMSAVLKAERSVTMAIIEALEEAGAQPTPDAAKQAWLKRCPNATPELRAALADGALPTVLVNDALARQMAFNKAMEWGNPNIPERPPANMVFIPAPAVAGTAATAENPARVRCPYITPPRLVGGMDWAGTVQFRARIATRDGVVEAVDVTLRSPADVAPHVVDLFRRTLIQSIATYECEGDRIFERDFEFKVQ